MCILLNVKKHEKTFALNVDIFIRISRLNLDLTLVRDYVYNEDSCESNCLFNYVLFVYF